MESIKDLAKETFRNWYVFAPNPPSNRIFFLNYDVEDIKKEIIKILLDCENKNSQRLFRLELIRIIEEEKIVEFEDQKNKYGKVWANDKTEITDIYNWLKSIVLDEILEQGHLENKTINQSKLKGFESSLTDEQIKALYQKLEGKYIDTFFENFKEIFNPQLSEKFKPIKRKKRFTNTLLIYFTCELFQKTNPSDYVSITEKCFESANNLSQTQNNSSSNTTRKPRGYQEIDKILEPYLPKKTS